MNKYLITVNVGSLNIGDVALTKSTTPYCMYLSAADVTNLAGLIASGQVILGAAGNSDIPVNGKDATLVDDFAISALNLAKENSSQLSQIASQVQGIEDDYILSEKYQNLLGDISLGANSTWSIWQNGLSSGATLVDGVISGLPNQTWGEVGFRFNNLTGLIGKTLLLTAICSTDSVGAAESLRKVVWRYNGSSLIGNAISAATSIPEGEKIRLSATITIEAGYDNIRFGIQEYQAPLNNIHVEKAMVIDITDDLAFNPDLVDDGYWTDYPSANVVKLYFTEVYSNVWNGKKALVIGDSLTAAGVWQLQLNTILGMTVTTHARGGAGLTQFVDGNGSDFAALSQADVTDKQLIIVYGGYNDRGTTEGVIGDVYPTQNTIAGRIQYIINTIHSLLAAVGNTDCTICFVTPHCAGKYSYITVDGYGEYPPASGRTMKTLADKITEIAKHNSLPCYNAWENSGINKFTWNIYSASPTAMTGETVNDQLHLNTTVGYPWIGTKIAKFVAGI